MIKDVGELILKYRKEAGLSQNALASAVGTQPHAISQYERKGICPKVYMFEDIMNACGYEIIIRKKGTKEE